MTNSMEDFFFWGGEGGGNHVVFKGSGMWWTSRRQQSITGGMKKIGCPLTANEGNHATNKETYVRTKLKTNFQFCARLVFFLFFLAMTLFLEPMVSVVILLFYYYYYYYYYYYP